MSVDPRGSIGVHVRSSEADVTLWKERWTGSQDSCLLILTLPLASHGTLSNFPYFLFPNFLYYKVGINSTGYKGETK